MQDCVGGSSSGTPHRHYSATIAEAQERAGEAELSGRLPLGMRSGEPPHLILIIAFLRLNSDPRKLRPFIRGRSRLEI